MDVKLTQHTEKLIENMLDFLESASEDEDILSDSKLDSKMSSRIYGETYGYEIEEKTKNQTVWDKPKERKTKPGFGKELNKLKEDYPIFNTQETVSSQNSANTHSSQIIGKDEPIWNDDTSDTCSKATNKSTTGYPKEENSDEKSNFNEWCKRTEQSPLSDDNEDAYVQEVHKAIYGDTQGHPINGSTEYFKAAQEYAVYGNCFLDFPENLTDVIPCESDSYGKESETANGGQFLVDEDVQDGSSKDTFNDNEFEKPATANGSTPPPPVAPNVAVASTAAYYQLSNGMQQRPGSSNSTIGSSTTYGMFLGNKVTYMAAAPTAPTLVYNQQTSTTANFVSNSLANAALATSPTILYSNPMLNATTQQYLNAFFKETQLLNSGGSTTQTTTTTAFYERLVYAQMLQQQIYHQNQQAAAVAAMIQHKQRVNAAAVAAAAAAAAAVAARQNASTTTNASTSSNGNNGIQASSSSNAAQSSGSSTTSSAFPALNMCGRQASMAAASNSTDFVSLKQQANTCVTQPSSLTFNGCEKSINAIKE